MQASAPLSRVPIANDALRSDGRTTEPMSRSGSIVWLCYPRFDGPSVFGSILDDDAGFRAS